MTKVYVAIPALGEVSDFQVSVLRKMEKQYKAGVRLVFPEINRRRKPVDYARNEMVKDFLATDCDILWFLDADITPHSDTLRLVTEHKDEWKVAGCACPMWTASYEDEDVPWLVFNVYKVNNGKAYPIRTINKYEPEWVDGIATGCLFIKREMFELIDEPWFCNKYHDKERWIIRGEDIDFIMKCYELKIKFYIDWHYVCRHEKKVDLFLIMNFCTEQANAAYQLGQMQAAAGPDVEMALVPANTVA